MDTTPISDMERYVNLLSAVEFTSIFKWFSFIIDIIGKENTTELLVNSGADVNIKFTDGADKTLLLPAIKEGNITSSVEFT